MKRHSKSIFAFTAIILALFLTSFLIWGALIRTNRSQPAAESLPASPAAGTATVGFPFGPYHLPPANYGSGGYTAAFLDLSKYSATDAAAVLEIARSKNIKLLVTLAGGGGRFKDTNSGNYSYSTFQQAINSHRALDLEKYVKNGTVIGNLIMDEPQDRNNWNGKTVTLTEIKQAAAYVKSIWPTVPVGIGSNPSFLNGGGWTAAGAE